MDTITTLFFIGLAAFGFQMVRPLRLSLLWSVAIALAFAYVVTEVVGQALNRAWLTITQGGVLGVTLAILAICVVVTGAVLLLKRGYGGDGIGPMDW